MIALDHARFDRRCIRWALCAVLAASSLLSLSAPAVTYARPLDKSQCRPGQFLPGSAGAEPFGSNVILGQAISLRVPARICGVRLLLHRNVGRAQAGPVVLTLVVGDQDMAYESVAFPAKSIPEDAAGILTFSFGCDGSDLPPAPSYTLQLSSPDSAAGAYTWANVYGGVVDWGGDNSLQIFTCQ